MRKRIQRWFQNKPGFLLGLLAVMIFLSCVPVCAQDLSSYVRVEDGADLLTSEEELQLRAKALELAENTGYDFFVLTVEDARGREAQEVAEDYYMDYETTLDGVVYLIDMDNREIYIATSGVMRYYLDDERWNEALDRAFEYVANKQYYQAFSAMLSDTGRYLEAGIQSGTYTVDEDTGEIVYYQEPPQLTLWEALFALTVALIVGGAFFGIVVGKYKMKIGGYTYSYQDNSRLKLRSRRDELIGHVVTHRHIPKPDPPSGHGFSGGGHSSTVHTGSGGNSFGGGGRKF